MICNNCNKKWAYLWNEILGVLLSVRLAQPKAEQLHIMEYNSTNAVKFWNSNTKNDTIMQVSNENLNEERDH